MGMFTVFQFDDGMDRDAVSIETHSGHRYLEEESSVLEYLRLFDSVSHSALKPQESQEFLEKDHVHPGSPERHNNDQELGIYQKSSFSGNGDCV